MLVFINVPIKQIIFPPIVPRHFHHALIIYFTKHLQNSTKRDSQVIGLSGYKQLIEITVQCTFRNKHLSDPLLNWSVFLTNFLFVLFNCIFVSTQQVNLFTESLCLLYICKMLYTVLMLVCIFTWRSTVGLAY